MIVCSNLKETFQKAPAVIFWDQLQSILSTIEEDTKETFSQKHDTFSEYSNNFSTFMGGNIYIIEAYDDLKEVITLHDKDSWEAETLPCKVIETDSYFLNITQCYGDYDSAGYLQGKEWAMLQLCTNNGGGDVYFIPSHLFKECPNIERSIEEFNESSSELLMEPHKIDTWQIPFINAFLRTV